MILGAHAVKREQGLLHAADDEMREVVAWYYETAITLSPVFAEALSQPRDQWRAALPAGFSEAPATVHAGRRIASLTPEPGSRRS